MTFFKDMVDKLNNVFPIKFFQKRGINYVVIGVLFFIVMFFSILSSLAPQKYELEVGQEVPVDIKAPRDIEDKIATEKQIQKAIDAVEPREKINPTIQIDIKKEIEKFFANLYQIRSIEDISKEEKIIQLKKMNELNLTDQELSLVIRSPQKDLESIESYIYEMIIQVMSTGIKEEQLEKERKSITNYFLGLKGFPEETKLLAINIVNSSIKANRFLDVETTQEKIEEAKRSVEKVIIKRGSMIVSVGDILAEEQLQLLQEAGMTKEDARKDFSLYMGIGILVIMSGTLLIAYMYVFNRELLGSVSKLYLLLIIFISVYLVAKTFYSVSPYIVPIATTAMLIGILIDARLAIVVNSLAAVLLTLINGNDLVFLIAGLIGGTVGTFWVTHTLQRSNIFISGLLVSLSNVLVILGLGLINSYELSKVFIDSFYGLLNGLFCAILTIGSLPLWESAFGILTPLKLLELSNPNHPVLKKLLLEAPGTYHHSIIVGNLSEAGADVIGANGLYARVGAYYHDIGKLKRPYFFKENQLTSENPHDKITAPLSTMIITGHVRDGIEISKKYKLPREITDIIEQHHGNTLVKYFYHKAINDEAREEVKEEQYRYDGTKPQSKEAAIVMLADSVEAAVRSIPEPNGDKIKNLIHKIIEDKLKDGQLDECDLTLKDLERIGDSFRRVLMGIFHERIEYPEINTEKAEVAE